MCINGAVFEFENEKDWQDSRRGVGRSPLSPEGATRNIDEKSNPIKDKPTYEWDHYSGLPGVGSYMDK